MARKNATTKNNKAKRDQAARLEEKKAARRQRMQHLRARCGAALSTVVAFFWERSWIFSIPVGLILALSLGSYSHEDPAFSVSTADDPQNYCGLWGAWAADFFYGVFGLSAWWCVLGSFMVAFFAVRSLVRRQRGETDPDRIKPPKFTALIGFFALMLGSSSLEALRFRRLLPGARGAR